MPVGARLASRGRIDEPGSLWHGPGGGLQSRACSRIDGGGTPFCERQPDGPAGDPVDRVGPIPAGCQRPGHHRFVCCAYSRGSDEPLAIRETP